MSSKTPHHAFSIDYNSLQQSLITTIDVISFAGGNKKTYSAIWDTGATHSVITQKIFDELCLFQIDTTTVNGVNSKKEVPVTIVNLILPNKVMVSEHRVTVCDIAGADMLIGMDVILNGDFSVCNHDNKTFFSFAIPPFENKIDFVEKSDKVNKRKKL